MWRCSDVHSCTVLLGCGATGGVQKPLLRLRIFFVFSDIQNTSRDIIQALHFHEHVNNRIWTFENLDLSWPPILIRPFRAFLMDSDESRSELVAGGQASPSPFHCPVIAQITLSSIKLSLSLTELYCVFAVCILPVLAVYIVLQINFRVL